MENDIKDYREKELKLFVLGNLILILIATGFLDTIQQLLGEESVWKAIAEMLGSTALLATVYIFVFVLDSVISEQFKFRLIWPIAGLPGNRIFTVIRDNNNDERFSAKKALSVYSDIYSKIDSEKDEKEKKQIQNEFWYGLYQKYEKYAQVYVSQRDFLLCRDMTIMIILILIGSIALSFYLGQQPSYKLLLFLIIEFLLLWKAARNNGERFVYNVIAKDLARFEENGKMKCEDLGEIAKGVDAK